jgi:ORF6N domain
MLMARIKKPMLIPEERIINKIHFFRGKKVILDFDLAEMYAVENKQLKRQVRRNIERFPVDFMFELNVKEVEILRSQIGTSSWGGSRYIPMAFTEQGVAMLSSVLNSRTAIEVNIQIIRAFTRMREMISSQKDILLKLQQIEKKLMRHDGKMKKYEEDMRLIFEALKKLLQPPPEPAPRPKIGFRRSNEKD